MSVTISIKGLDKVMLLKALWENRLPAAFFNSVDAILSGTVAPSFDWKQARQAVESRIDYFCGRGIKCDLSGDDVDPWLYDRDAGKGAFQKIVESLRASEQE